MVKFPREGFKSVTIKEDVYKKLEDLGKETCRTVPQVVEFLLKTHLKKESVDQ